ncbi:MAG: polyribonucleotide nucleotidyltransferase [Flavobacteriales bacterium]|nr:polyribonucleotide nucleotidyltransferase [Flavobacteriales bacterium]MBK6755447.1 polyribonucleotide nucleotidyltransferase [Flavobacteriales bacterium]MBK7086566.1 polyribonucleotide nucleotidyltransferase [Flavobacteriales bacterium]MBK7269302.1 polyribonucleotide nucleotidyltransferase [Flavobacteriales bacterium]MBK7753899.1 polyribonucleotide nucleotidyltransferase [Flavobacteriales bacterium]
MRPQGITKTIDLGDGRTIIIETGVLAKQADGSVTVRLGDTILLGTVVATKEAREGIDFLPLQVEYREKFSAAGRFPGGFFKREARPSDHEVLTSRLVDRALRPLFPDDFHGDTQVVVSLMSSDKKNQSDALACLAAAAALAVSDIPFGGPVSEARVARIGGRFVINPEFADMANADMDLIVAATASDILMVEGEMKEVQEADMIEAIKLAHDVIKRQCQALTELSAAVPKSQTKRTYNHENNDPVVGQLIHDFCYQKYYDLAMSPSGKEERSASFAAVKDACLATLTDEQRSDKAMLARFFKKTQKKAVRNVCLDHGKRLDGRKTTEIRPIWSEVDVLPGTHGSAIFTRGETQAINLVTLGSSLDEQTIDTAISKGSVNFMLHYNFPSFSTGEVKPIRGPGRREVGHGNLALRALKPVIPPAPGNPYTIRLNCDILESNGSSSMATVCSGTLALMDAGIKISAPVSGIAMGMISDGTRHAILSDILGDEDFLGDMDFKICGTAKGITATQMDMKVDGLPYEVLAQALEQARQGRLHILGEMLKTLDKPREDYKPHAPRIVTFDVPKESIGPIIGPGGRVIQEIQAETGATISIDEVDGRGIVEISSENKASIDAAVARVKAIAFPPQADVGAIYTGKVKTIMPYGAFVEVVPGMDGLLHVSELDWKRVERVEDILKEGEMVQFQVTGKDPRTGKLKLSRRALLPKPEGYVEREPAMDGGDRGDRPRREFRDRGPRRD